VCARARSGSRFAGRWRRSCRPRSNDGTAKTSDGDQVAKTGTLTFAPGETTTAITIEVKGDSKRVTDETFYPDLFGNSSNSLFTKNRGVGTILNDD
jgi:hypothetical protein